LSFASGREMLKIDLEDQTPNTIGIPVGTSFTPDGRYILGGVFGRKGLFTLWHRETGKVVKTFHEHSSGPCGVTMSADGGHILSCSNDGSVRLWQTDTGKQLFCLDNLDNKVRSVAFSPDGKRFLTGGEDGAVILRDATTGEEIARFRGHVGNVN